MGQSTGSPDPCLRQQHGLRGMAKEERQFRAGGVQFRPAGYSPPVRTVGSQRSISGYRTRLPIGGVAAIPFCEFPYPPEGYAQMVRHLPVLLPISG